MLTSLCNDMESLLWIHNVQMLPQSSTFLNIFAFLTAPMISAGKRLHKNNINTQT